ncbi:micronuclear linker histone poly -like, partial [Pelobates cultripes]
NDQFIILMHPINACSESPRWNCSPSLCNWIAMFLQYLTKEDRLRGKKINKIKSSLSCSSAVKFRSALQWVDEQTWSGSGDWIEANGAGADPHSEICMKSIMGVSARDSAEGLKDGRRRDGRWWFLGRRPGWQVSHRRASAAVVGRKLAALAFLFKFNGWEDATKHFLVRQALKGFRRGYEVTLFSVVFSFAFFGAFRVSELLSSNRQGAGGLQAVDVEVWSNKVVINLRRSKTDEDCSSLSKFQFLRVFRKALARLGVDPGQFGTHSFRIGAATEAARLGLGDEWVKRIGRWGSLRFRSYIRPDKSD